jgi:hypothetical protein
MFERAARCFTRGPNTIGYSILEAERERAEIEFPSPSNHVNISGLYFIKKHWRVPFLHKSIQRSEEDILSFAGYGHARDADPVRHLKKENTFN